MASGRMGISVAATLSPRDLSCELLERIGIHLHFAQAAVWNDLCTAFRPYHARPQLYAALVLIEANPGCTQQEIGFSLRMKRPNVVALIDELEARRFVERQTNPDDRRTNRLNLLTDGRIALAQIKQAHHEHEERINAILDQDEQAILVKLLRKIEKIGKEDRIS